MHVAELSNWLRLWHLPGIGPRTYLRLLNRFDNDPAKIVKASVTDLITAGLSHRLACAIQHLSTSQYQTDIAWLQASDQHHIITFIDAEYPTLLREIPDPPPILYIVGNPTALSSQPCLAMVGSRKATSLGKHNALQLAKSLAELGISIVSGLADGIDGQAHRGALLAKQGKTIAVLGNGLDQIYPHRHSRLSHEIVVNGALLSEFPPATKPLPQHFPRRNRIISGLCLGVIIIEAASKSGSLITARLALEQNREVFALPGPINSLQSCGCHSLIQNGAKLITNVADILVELPAIIVESDLELAKPKQQPVVSFDSNALLGVLEYTPLPIDTLIEKSGLTPDQVSSMLIELEVSGHVTCDAYGLYSRSALERVNERKCT